MNYEKTEKAALTKKRISNVIVYTLLTVWGIIVLFPFYWMILTSVKEYGAYNSEWVPKLYTLAPTLENYKSAFTEVPLGGYFLNTVIFTLVTTAIMLVVTVLSAFAFSRLDFKGKDLVFTLFLSLMMIPNELVIITNFVTITDLELRNTFMGLIVGAFLAAAAFVLLRLAVGRAFRAYLDAEGLCLLVCGDDFTAFPDQQDRLGKPVPHQMKCADDFFVGHNATSCLSYNRTSLLSRIARPGAQAGQSHHLPPEAISSLKCAAICAAVSAPKIF